MLPLSDVIPPRTSSRATLFIISVTTLVFGCQMAAGPQAHEALAVAFGLEPARFSPTKVVMSLLVHASAWHLAAGMIAVWLFGENVEDRLGHVRFLLFYLFCGAVAAVAHAALHPASAVPVVGASGAAAGVMGAYFVTYPRSRVLTLVPAPPLLAEVPSVLFLAVWWVMQVLSRVGSTTAELGGVDVSGGLSLLALLTSFAAGAGVCVVVRRPLDWDR